MYRKMILIAASLAAVLFVNSCSPSQNATQQKIDSLISQGKVQLTNHQYTDAATSFETVLTSYDQNNNQARFGAATAILLNQVDVLVNTLSSLLTTFGFSVFNSSSPVLMPEYNYQGTTAINQLIGGILYQALMIYVYQAKGYLDAIIKSGDMNFTFQINSFPISIANLYPIGDFGGTYDMEEVYYLDAVLNGLDGALDLLMSVNMDIQLGPILSYVTTPGRLSNINIDTIMELLGFVMVSSPDALTIEPVDGMQNIQAAQLAFSTALQQLIDGVNFIMKPPHDESNNVITYGVANNAQYLYLHIKSITANGYSTGSVQIPISSSAGGPITEIAQRVENDINGGPNAQPVTFDTDIAPVLSMAVVTLLQSGLVQGILNEALASLSASSKSEIQQLLKFLSVDTLTGILTSLIPGNIELDLNQYFTHPVSLRAIFPAWVIPGQTGTTITGDTFTASTDPNAPIVTTIILEYECSSSQLSLFYCPKTATITDAPHFLGPTGNGIPNPVITGTTIGPIPPDGIGGSMPYIPFIDPTLGKILYTTATCTPNAGGIDISATCSASGTEHMPSLLELNYLIQRIGQAITSFLP